MTDRLRRLMVSIAVLACVAVSRAVHAAAPPTTAPTAARYITLWYPLPDAAKGGVTEFYNEVTVRREVSGSYFCAAGFTNGYFGIQRRPDKKVVIFSVWDAGKKVDHPDEVAAENQVKVISLGQGVHYTRFGNEGTGAHSDVGFEWEVGKTYQFFLRSTVTGKATLYEGWFRDPTAAAGWMHIATFEAPDGGRKMRNLYSFLEDFRRDGKSATEIRRAEVGNGWARQSPGDEWFPLLTMRFATMNQRGAAPAGIDAGVVGDRFYYQNGGDTQTTMPLNTTATRPATAGAKPPIVPATQPTP